MITLVSLIFAVKYLLCGIFPSNPLVIPEQVSKVGREMVPPSFQIDWKQRPDASIVENQETNVN